MSLCLLVICLTDCGVENCAVRFVIVLMKNMPKSSAVRVDEGGGGGGQRREEHFFKSCLTVKLKRDCEKKQWSLSHFQRNIFLILS